MEMSCKLRAGSTLWVVTKGRSWEGRAGYISWVAAEGGGEGGSHTVFRRERVSLSRSAVRRAAESCVLH